MFEVFAGNGSQSDGKSFLNIRIWIYLKKIYMFYKNQSYLLKIQIMVFYFEYESSLMIYIIDSRNKLQTTIKMYYRSNKLL